MKSDVAFRLYLVREQAKLISGDNKFRIMDICVWAWEGGSGRCIHEQGA